MSSHKIDATNQTDVCHPDVVRMTAVNLCGNLNNLLKDPDVFALAVCQTEGFLNGNDLSPETVRQKKWAITCVIQDHGPFECREIRQVLRKAEPLVAYLASGDFSVLKRYAQPVAVPGQAPSVLSDFPEAPELVRAGSHSVFGIGKAAASAALRWFHSWSSESSSHKVGDTPMMDVAGSRDNATACAFLEDKAAYRAASQKWASIRDYKYPASITKEAERQLAQNQMASTLSFKARIQNMAGRVIEDYRKFPGRKS